MKYTLIWDVNTVLTKSVQMSCLPRIKYFGLPVSVTWLVYRNVNDDDNNNNNNNNKT